MTTIRKAIRRPRVLEATGWSVPTLYRKIKERVSRRATSWTRTARQSFGGKMK